MKIDNFILVHQINHTFKPILMEANVHFRANVNSISLISISPEKPELGIKCNADKYKSTDQIIDLIKEDINKVNLKSAPKRSTPEKELQSWIIKNALLNDYSLAFNNDIKFVTSELAIYNSANERIVNDVLGFNTKTNQLCIIELKSDRHLTRLTEQINNFSRIVHENFPFFEQLVSIFGFNSGNPLSKELSKIIVWPDEKTSPLLKFKKDGIDEITYAKKQNDYVFKNFD